MRGFLERIRGFIMPVGLAVIIIVGAFGLVRFGYIVFFNNPEGTRFPNPLWRYLGWDNRDWHGRPLETRIEENEPQPKVLTEEQQDVAALALFMNNRDKWRRYNRDMRGNKFDQINASQIYRDLGRQHRDAARGKFSGEESLKIFEKAADLAEEDWRTRR